MWFLTDCIASRSTEDMIGFGVGSASGAILHSPDMPAGGRHHRRLHPSSPHFTMQASRAAQFPTARVSSRANASIRVRPVSTMSVRAEISYVMVKPGGHVTSTTVVLTAELLPSLLCLALLC